MLSFMIISLYSRLGFPCGKSYVQFFINYVELEIVEFDDTIDLPISTKEEDKKVYDLIRQNYGRMKK